MRHTARMRDNRDTEDATYEYTEETVVVGNIDCSLFSSKYD